MEFVFNRASGGSGDVPSRAGGGGNPDDPQEQYDDLNYGSGVLPDDYSKLHTCSQCAANALHTTMLY